MKLWIKTLSAFSNGDELYTWDEFNFCLDSVSSYNESDNGFTVIGIDGSRFIIAIKYKDFKDFMDEIYDHKEKIDPKALYEFKEQG